MKKKNLIKIKNNLIFKWNMNFNKIIRHFQKI